MIQCSIAGRSKRSSADVGPMWQCFMQSGDLIPADWPSLTVEADEAFNLTSFALSLLLVFRTNESYSRWLEARKAWSGILIRSRDLVRQVCSTRLAWLQPIVPRCAGRQAGSTTI